MGKHRDETETCSKGLQTKISLENTLSFLSLVEFEIMVTPKAVRSTNFVAVYKQSVAKGTLKSISMLLYS